MKFTTAIAIATVATLGSAAASPIDNCPVMNVADVARVAASFDLFSEGALNTKTVACATEIMKSHPLLASEVYDMLCRNEPACLMPTGNQREHELQKRGVNFFATLSSDELRERMSRDKITMGSFGWGYQVYIPGPLVNRVMYADAQTIRSLVDADSSNAQYAVASIQSVAKSLRMMNKDNKGVVLGASRIVPQLALPRAAADFM